MPSLSSGKPATASRKKQIVLEAAVALLSERGYDQVSVDRLARAAGVSKATVYTCFKGKAEIFRQSTALLARRLSPPVSPPPAGDDPRSTLVELALWLQRASTSPEFIGSYRLCVAQAGRFPEVAGEAYRCLSLG